jgi:replication factor C subunit 1
VSCDIELFILIRHSDSARDSEDEDDEPPPKRSTPGRPAKKAPKEEEKVEETTASSYFSSTSKSKAKRAAPVKETKPKAQPKPKTMKLQPKKEVYADDEDDEADDIYAEAFQKKEDDYEEEPDNEDNDMADFVVPDDEDDEDVKPKKRGAKVSSTPRKRKAILEDDGEEEETPKKKASTKRPPAKKPPAKKPPAKKPRVPAKKKEEPEDDSEVKKIHDAIPTVLPPTPPPSSDTKKFNFRDAQQRSAPAAQGSKELPTGADNCLAGLTFVFTGVLDSLSREDGQQLVKRHGGKITTAPSRKTSYVVLGSEAGPKKLETIRVHKIKSIDEDGLFQLIRTLPANGGDGKAAQEYAAKKVAEEKKVKEMADEMEKTTKAEAQKAKEKGVPSSDPSAQLWTVKYAPTNMMQICGNKGVVEKLQRWLKAWPKNLKSNFQLRGADGSGGYRAVMIHGPPGIGKTTAAHLIARLEGYDVLEYNASDTRSKKLMEETMRGVLDNTSLRGYFAPDKEQVDMSKKKLVLIMDEVDGMSAGDRGGVGQLAALCRKTSVSLELAQVHDAFVLILPGTYHLHLQREEAPEDEAF